MRISGVLEDDRRTFDAIFLRERNFDLILRSITIGGREAALYFVDGFVKDELLEKIMEHFYKLKPEELTDAAGFESACVPYCEVSLLQEQDDIVTAVLSGMTAALVDGFGAALMLDLRTYPQRATAEPDRDKVLRGSRDGFVETMVLSAALVRRRIRDPRLCVEHHSVGRVSHTDTALCYIDGLADGALLAELRKKLDEAGVDALSMNQESMAELLTGRRRWNPFPRYKFTERPDTAAAQILEGDIVLLVDNSPSALILPATIFDIAEDANDYYFPPLTGAWLRITRLAVMALTLLLTPLWLLALRYPGAVPPWLAFVLLEEAPFVPVAAQLLILELVIDGLKLSSLNTPSMLSSSFGIIGAIILGDFAVQSGWFCAEALLYMAFVAMANYSQPGYELGYSIKFMRMALIALTALLGIWGFAAGLALTAAAVLTTKTPGGKPYLWPIVPFSARGIRKLLFRL